MKALLKKEILSSKNVFKSYLSSILFFIVLTYLNKNITFLTMLINIYPINQIIISMTNDDFFNWNQYALTMPIRRKDIVKSKYFFFLILIFSLGLGSFFLSLLMINRLDINIIELILIFLGSSLAIIFIFSLTMPLLYKYGIEKARTILLSIIALCFFLGFSGINFLTNYSNLDFEIFMNQNYRLIFVFLILFLTTMFFISLNISIKIFESKDL